jgi:hypothetical protein
MCSIMTRLLTMVACRQMLGNPSSCGKVGQDTRCECEEGYGGRQQFDDYCERKGPNHWRF